MRISDWSSDVCSSDLLDLKNLLKIVPLQNSLPAMLIRDRARTRSRHHRRRDLLDSLALPDRAARSQLLWHHRILSNDLPRSEEHTSELQSLMRISYAAFCLKKKQTHIKQQQKHS